MKVFEARCERCNDINEIDFIQRFSNDYYAPDIIRNNDDCMNYALSQHESIFSYCPKCNKWTLHKVVTLVYESSSDNDNI